MTVVADTRPELRLPRPLRDVVLRPRLFDLLDDGTSDRALTLVSAPPGSGKTVLLTSWLRERPAAAPTVWLGLREGGRASLWGPVLDAVGRTSRTRMPLGLAEPELEDAAGFADRFTDLLAGLDTPLVLVVDDLHNASPAALASLDRLLHAPPAQLRVVASSRLDPALALHVLRLTGDLAELRASDLAFDEDEARELFAHFGLEVAEPDLRAVLTRTEGWAAGLRLLALSLIRRADPEAAFERLALDERPVSEYLAQEVLATQTAETRSFLIRTSLVETLDGELASALTGRADGERILDRIHRDNLFLERLPGEAGEYRYHPLFRALLVAEAGYELRDELPGLHEQVATLLARRGRPLEALRHAVDGERWDLVSTVLANHWAEALAAQADEGADEVVASVPEDRAAAPVVGAFSALLRLVAGDARKATALLAEASRGREAVPAEALAGFDALIRFASALAARARASFPRAAELAVLQIELAPVEAASTTDEDRRRALGLATLGISQLWGAAMDEAEASLEEATALARLTHMTVAEAEGLAHLAVVELERGRLRRAARIARAALELDERQHLPERPATLVAHVVLALAQHAWGEDHDAAASLAAAEAVARRTGDVPGRALVALTSAELTASRGGDDAEGALLHLRAVKSRSPAAKYALVSGRIAALDARLLAETGRLDDAAAAVAALDGDAYSAVAAARLLLAQGAPAEALARLRARGTTPPLLEIEALVVEAVAFRAAGDDRPAQESLSAALALAEPEVVRRPFLDAALPVRELLAAHVRTSNAHRWLATELIAAVDGRRGQEGAAPAELLEPLSEREREVLRYLPTIMSNADIAAELLVSVNTVKTHIKSIYRKLGATRRQQAVRRARQLRLL